MQAGIVNQQMARPHGRSEISPQAVRESMNMPVHLQNAFDRVIAAGMKLMYDKKTHPLMMQGLDTKPIPQLLGEGVVGLMGILSEQSNNTIPPEVVIPAGIYLIAEAADFFERSGALAVSSSDIAEATQIYIYMIIQKFGGDPDQMMAKLSQFDPSQLQQMAQQAQQQQQQAPQQTPQQGV